VTEALAYLPAIALFSFVTIASALMRHEMLLLACMPAVFVALVMGFVMALYAQDAFGMAPVGGALAAVAVPGWWSGRRLRPKHLLIAIYLGWAAALVLALIGVGFPDRG
jgi:ABC-type dipeptide/oligopeptide/nickel transport system permease component